MNVTSLTSWKSHDVIHKAWRFRLLCRRRHHRRLCISAAYRISSSGSSLTFSVWNECSFDALAQIMHSKLGPRYSSRVHGMEWNRQICFCRRHWIINFNCKPALCAAALSDVRIKAIWKKSLLLSYIGYILSIHFPLIAGGNIIVIYMLILFHVAASKSMLHAAWVINHCMMNERQKLEKSSKYH
jgi:hypothetical protein